MTRAKVHIKLPTIPVTAADQHHGDDEAWQQVAREICARHKLSYTSLRRSPQGENIIFFVDERFVIKIYLPLRASYAREKAALELVGDKLGLKTPALLYAGEIESWSYLVMTQLVGLPLREVWLRLAQRERLEIISCLAGTLKNLHLRAAPLSPHPLKDNWQGFIERQVQTCITRQRTCDANPEWLARLPTYISERLELLPTRFEPVLLHGDVHPLNVLLAQEGGRWQMSGLFDFGDSLVGYHEYEFVAPGVLLVQGNRALQREFLLAYGYEEARLDASLRARLMLLTILYECSDLRKYALRLDPAAVHYTLDELEAAIWTFAAA